MSNPFRLQQQQYINRRSHSQKKNRNLAVIPLLNFHESRKKSVNTANSSRNHFNNTFLNDEEENPNFLQPLLKSQKENIVNEQQFLIQSNTQNKEKLSYQALPIRSFQFQQNKFGQQKQKNIEILQQSPSIKSQENNNNPNHSFNQSFYQNNKMPCNQSNIFYKRMVNCKVIKQSPQNIIQEVEQQNSSELPTLLLDQFMNSCPTTTRNTMKFIETINKQVFNKVKDNKLNESKSKNKFNQSKDSFDTKDMLHSKDIFYSKQVFDNKDNFANIQNEQLSRNYLSSSSFCSTSEKSKRTKSTLHSSVNNNINQTNNTYILINAQNNVNSSKQSNSQYNNKSLQQSLSPLNKSEIMNQNNRISHFQKVNKQKKNVVQQRMQNIKKLQLKHYSPPKINMNLSTQDQQQDQDLKENINLRPHTSYSRRECNDQDTYKNSLQLKQVTNSSSGEDSPLSILSNRKKVKSQSEFSSLTNRTNQGNILIHLEQIKNHDVDVKDQQIEQTKSGEITYINSSPKQKKQKITQYDLNILSQQTNISNEVISSQNQNNCINVKENKSSINQEQNEMKQKNNNQQDDQNKKDISKQTSTNLEQEKNSTNQSKNLLKKQISTNTQIILQQDSNEGNYYKFIEQCNLNSSQEYAKETKLMNTQKSNEDETPSKKEFTNYSNFNDYSHNLTRKYDIQKQNSNTKNQQFSNFSPKTNKSQVSSTRINNFDKQIIKKQSEECNSRQELHTHKNLQVEILLQNQEQLNQNNYANINKTAKSLKDNKETQISFSTEAEKKIINLQTKINRQNPQQTQKNSQLDQKNDLQVQKNKEDGQGYYQLKQKRFEMDNNMREQRNYSTEGRSFQAGLRNNNLQQYLQYFQQSIQNNNMTAKGERDNNTKGVSPSTSFKFVWDKLSEDEPKEMNLQMWNQILEYLSIPDLSLMREVCKSWNKNGEILILQRHNRQLQKDIQRSDEIKNKYDIQQIYKDIYDIFSPLCQFSIQQLQQPLFLNYQPPCLQIILECLRIFLSHDKIYTCRDPLHILKRFNIFENSNVPMNFKSYHTQNTKLNEKQELSQKQLNSNRARAQSSNGAFSQQNSCEGRVSNLFSFYEDYAKIEQRRLRFYSKLFLGENSIKKSIFNDAVSQNKDLLWLLCTFDFNQINKVQQIIRQNLRVLNSKKILKTFGEVTSKISDFLFGVVDLIIKIQSQYPQIIEYVNSIRYCYSLDYQIGDYFTKKHKN